MRRWMLWILPLAAAAAAGCNDARNTQGVLTVDRVDSVELRTDITALNWDSQPGPDGVRAMIRFWKVDNDVPSAVAVKGTLAFDLYLGVVGGDSLAAQTPFQTWTFPADQLARVRTTDLGLTCYPIVLAWGRHVPTADRVTLVAKYVPLSGPAVYSVPSTIVMGD